MAFFLDKVAIVTGGASGLGRGLSEALCAEGARVIIADIDLEKAQSLADALAREGHHAQAAELDVTREEQVDALVQSVVHEHGKLDLMINNAGIGVGGEFQDIGPETWRRVVDINLLGAVYGTQSAYRQMCAQGSGHIVNIASLWGLCGGVLQTAYCATKHALVGMSQGLRAEAKDLGVKVQVVCPGYLDTGLFDTAIYSESLDPDDVRERVPFTFIDVETAVRRILRGIRRNRAIIVFPFYVRFIWWIQRISPFLVTLFFSRLARRQRERWT
jgi:NAD(P)-dependent dehydrogenase (short-subunit alcohol dehydrogenase family)